MANRVNPPKQLQLPNSIRANNDLKKAFDDRDFILFQLWKRAGGGNDLVDDIGNEQVDTDNLFALIGQVDEIESESGFLDEQLPNTEEIESELGFSDDPIPVIERLRNAVATAIDYTTSESEIVICTDLVTVTLNPTPDDQELSTVKRTNGKVIIDGNGKTIDGDNTVTLIRDFVSLDFMFLSETNEWSII